MSSGHATPDAIAYKEVRPAGLPDDGLEPHAQGGTVRRDLPRPRRAGSAAGESEHLVNVLPLTRDTNGVLNAGALAKQPKGA